jgi:HipA-like protein
MKVAEVYRNGELAGKLIQHNPKSYEYRYDDNWFGNADKPALSLTLPKKQKVYKSDHLFPFFFNLLSEGVNRQLQCKHFKIDENDHFGLLLATAFDDTIGPVTIKEIK